MSLSSNPRVGPHLHTPGHHGGVQGCMGSVLPASVMTWGGVPQLEVAPRGVEVATHPGIVGIA